MKVSINWLKSLVDTDLSADDIAHKLTMAGLEVEEMTPVAAQFTKIVVAEIKTVKPHPNADKLRVTEVDAGTGALLQIVCGAPNVAVGMRVPCALVGAVLPGITIKEAKLRGEDSNGMLCSARELGLSDDHGGLLSLPADAPIGEDIRVYLNLDDVVLTLKMTPNRGDCLSMIGVARDLAAITNSGLKMPVDRAVSATSADARSINIGSPKACGHYLGRVITNINAKAQTPEWMSRRLIRAGFRPISPLVDITNYLTLERGRPMHAFDNDKLTGSIDVRFANVGETITLLNEQQVALTPDYLVIADERGAQALGGVMGGLDTSVTDSTTNIFFEAAYFDPDVIQGKTRLLGINSDAAFRFERGVDPTSARAGIEYATQLAIDICGTADTKVGPICEAKGELPVRASVRVRPQRVNALIGMNIETPAMTAIFKQLCCEIKEESGGSQIILHLTPPSYRFDLNIEADFAEEVARIVGYENVPATPPRATVPISSVPSATRTNSTLRHTMAAMGYQEVINYSFVPETWETELLQNPQPVRLSNPIAAQMSVMRTSLLGGLIATLQHNLNHGLNHPNTRAKFFEIGRCFTGSEANLANQPERIAGLVYGARHAEQWGEDGANRMDFYSLKGEVESLLSGRDVRFESAQHPALHPGRSAAILVNGKKVGWIGELHPKWQQHYELAIAPIAFEIDVADIVVGDKILYQPISRMQAVRRDVALLVDDSVSIQAITDATKRLKLANLIDFGLFDLYRGQHLENGKKSLAFRIVMQDTERTLTDIECDQVVAQFVNVMSHEFGATLRK
jgi:phenylalanyl-tRNA synthetase beta chain